MTRPLPDLDPAATALILIDLQRGIVARPAEPRSGADVVRNAVRLAEAAREKGASAPEADRVDGGCVEGVVSRRRMTQS